jgi:hypothetical protein
LSLNPQLWLDAADLTTITESSGSVTQWNDKSGNGFNVSQATGAAQPTTNSATRNGLNVLVFDGGDVLNYSGTTGINVGSMSVYVVASQTTNVNFCGLVSVHASTGDDFNNTGSINLDTSNASFLFNINRGAAGAPTTTGSSAVNGSGATPFGQYTGIFNPNGNLTAYRDGVAGTGTANALSFTTANGGFLIGGRFLSGAISASFRLDGQICEVIVYNQNHTDVQRRQVENYLKTKWGTP